MRWEEGIEGKRISLIPAEDVRMLCFPDVSIYANKQVLVSKVLDSAAMELLSWQPGYLTPVYRKMYRNTTSRLSRSSLGLAPLDLLRAMVAYQGYGVSLMV